MIERLEVDKSKLMKEITDAFRMKMSAQMDSDCKLIQEGMSDKVSTVIQYLSTFIAGAVVGFIQGWQLTLVLASITPLLAICSE